MKTTLDVVKDLVAAAKPFPYANPEADRPVQQPDRTTGAPVSLTATVAIENDARRIRCGTDFEVIGSRLARSFPLDWLGDR